MQIAPFEEQDTDAVVSLWREAFPDQPAHNQPEFAIRLKLAVQRELFFVAKTGKQVVGTLMAGYDGHRGWIYAVAVSPAHRRHGIGTQLLRHAEQALRDLGCPKINLQVRRSNSGVVEFYRKLGFVVEERISMGKRLRLTDP